MSEPTYFNPTPPPMPVGGIRTPSRRRVRRGSIVAALAGLLMIVGAVLPWLELKAGTARAEAALEVGSFRPLLAGLIVIVLMLLTVAKDSLWLFGVPAIASLASAASAGIDYLHLRDAIGDLPAGVSGSIGFGIHMCIVGGIVASIASVAAAIE